MANVLLKPWCFTIFFFFYWKIKTITTLKNLIFDHLRSFHSYIKNTYLKNKLSSVDNYFELTDMTSKYRKQSPSTMKKTRFNIILSNICYNIMLIPTTLLFFLSTYTKHNPIRLGIYIIVKAYIIRQNGYFEIGWSMVTNPW